MNHACRQSTHTVRLWNINDNTLAGDAAVTIFVQLIVTWLIDTLLVCNDVRTRAFRIQPLFPKTSNNKFLEWYLSVEGMDVLDPNISLLRRVKRVIGGAIRALFLSVPVFFLWWPIGVGIMAGVGEPIGGAEYAYNHYPVCTHPQCAKHDFCTHCGLSALCTSVQACQNQTNGMCVRLHSVSLPETGHLQFMMSNASDSIPCADLFVCAGARGLQACLWSHIRAFCHTCHGIWCSDCQRSSSHTPF